MTLLLALALTAMPLDSELKRYEETAIELSLRSGFRAEMRKRGVVIPFSFLAEERFAVFGESERALREAGYYRALNVAGVSGLAGGTLLLAAAIAVALLPASPSWRAPVAYTLFSTSAAAISGGIGALIISPLFVSRAVATYNEDMFDQW